MGKCKHCGTSIGMLTSAGPGGAYCKPCNAARLGDRIDTDPAARAAYDAEVDAVMLTTETVLSLPIAERIEIVTAECAFGMNIFKDLFAGVRDVVGGRSKAVQQTLRDSRRVALLELKREAHAVGADAVIGVDLDYVELSAAGSMVMLVASGTAVRLGRPE